METVRRSATPAPGFQPVSVLRWKLCSHYFRRGKQANMSGPASMPPDAASRLRRVSSVFISMSAAPGTPQGLRPRQHTAKRLSDPFVKRTFGPAVYRKLSPALGPIKSSFDQ